MFEYEINHDHVKEADIVVGLASFNEEDNISYPAKQASIGLKKYFPDKKSVIINCDNHSPDDTKSAFLATETDVPKIYITTPPDTPGKGYNFENMFRKSCELGAKIIICVDADLESITPEWIKYLGEPVKGNYDYATPIYARHKYDGTITNNICFPLVYGVLGKNIRQPIGGDFALSGRLAKHLLLQPWHRTTEEYGIDIFMSMNAILGGYKTCQVGLGSKIHKPSAPKLGPMFLQVVKTAFLQVTNNIHKWEKIQKVQNTRKSGLRKLGRAQKLTVDTDAVKKKALDGYRQHKKDIARYLSPDSFDAIKDSFRQKEPRITDDMWVRIVYDMLAGFETSIHKTEVVEALRPLYFARTLTFIKDTIKMSTPEAEKLIIKQAKKFFAGRDYLIDKLVTNKRKKK